jgi:hypothetical protein
VPCEKYRIIQKQKASRMTIHQFPLALSEKKGKPIEAKRLLCRICDSHSGGYEEFYIVGYNAM